MSCMPTASRTHKVSIEDLLGLAMRGNDLQSEKARAINTGPGTASVQY